MLKLLTGENLITQMANYFEFLSAIAITNKGINGKKKRDTSEQDANDAEVGLNYQLYHSMPIKIFFMRLSLTQIFKKVQLFVELN